ncbi:MAG: hypothetical protein HY606_14665 [Planctomycetes bacterium]|nr:hypothetical protein [Planctomycetota bacterium]
MRETVKFEWQTKLQSLFQIGEKNRLSFPIDIAIVKVVGGKVILLREEENDEI